MLRFVEFLDFASGLERLVDFAAPVELGAPCDDSYTEPMSNIRKVIARSMVASLSTMAQLTLEDGRCLRETAQ